MKYKIFTTLKNDGYWEEYKDKGHLDAYLNFNDLIYHINFTDLFGLRNYLFPENYSISKIYPLDANEIVVRNITKDQVKKTVEVLIENRYFDHLKPIDDVAKIEDIQLPKSLANQKLYLLE